MDVGAHLNKSPPIVQSAAPDKEGFHYSPLDLDIYPTNIKKELNSSYENAESATEYLLSDSRISRESDSGFNDLLCGGVALQVQLKEKLSRLKFFCSYCSKGFAKKQQLQNHIKTHTQEKNFVCLICKKSFVHKQQLTNHDKTHTGRKDFECAFCNKRFSLKQQMQIHTKTHTGEKNFDCDMCEKRFITKQQLQNHINSHLGVKPFTCSVCGKNFAHKQQLTRHEARHVTHAHCCVECNLEFKGNKLLLKHINELHTTLNSL